MLQYIGKVAHRQRGDDGAAAVEYGLLVAAVAAIIVLVVFAIGSWVKGAFDKTCNDLSSQAPAITGKACPSAATPPPTP